MSAAKPPARRFSRIVFDLDGTLIESHRDIAAALNDVLRSLGCPTHDPEVVRTMVGHGVDSLLTKALGPGEPQRLQAARDRFRDAYRARLLETTTPYPGVFEGLARLRDAGCALSIATNKPSFFTLPIVSALHLQGAGIQGVACADEVARKKPDPAVIALALERTPRDADRARMDRGGLATPSVDGSRAADDVLYVGDMVVDVETARAFGVAIAGAGWGFDPRGLAEAGPDYWLEDFQSILALVLGAS